LHDSVAQVLAVDQAAVAVAQARTTVALSGRPQVSAGIPETEWSDLVEQVKAAGMTPDRVHDADAVVALLHRVNDGDTTAAVQASAYLVDLQGAIKAVRAGTVRQQQERAYQVGLVLAIAVISGLVMVLGAAIWVRRSLFVRFQDMSRTARRIVDGSPERLDARIRDPLGAVAAAFNAGIDRQQGLVEALGAENARSAVARQISDGLDMALSSADLFEVLGKAMTTVGAGNPTEFIVVEPMGGGLTSAASTHGSRCLISDAEQCVALRRGAIQKFGDSDSINACPKLQDRDRPARSATCVPATFLGQPLGVLHTVLAETGPDGSPADPVSPAALDMTLMTELASLTANRLGTMRAFAREESNARTDPLTGLSNRREFERKARGMKAGVLAMADLDHFKLVNDTFGHEAGDQALMAFADVLRTATRGQNDMIARWGGEEFALVMPGATVSEAIEVIGRIQETLARVCLTRTPAFTCSWGIAAFTGSVTETVRQVDHALYAAKENGRNCWVVAGQPRSELGDADTNESTEPWGSMGAAPGDHGSVLRFVEDSVVEPAGALDH
jgi:diguanylate cyclase (GGDEF)-like protein